MLIDIPIFDIVHVPNLPFGMVRRGPDVALAEEDSDGFGGGGPGCKGSLGCGGWLGRSCRADSVGKQET